MAGRQAGTVKILSTAVPHGWGRGLGFECENSTINLMSRAVAPHLCLVLSSWQGRNSAPRTTCASSVPVLKSLKEKGKFFSG